MEIAMISASHITIQRNGVDIITDFSIEIAPGHITALIGPNGSGKSTLLAALAGDLAVTHGEIQCDARTIDTYSIEELARLRSLSPQSQRFTMSFTVGDVLRMACTNSGDFSSIKNAVLALDIERLQHRKVTSLSGGEQQRVSIAMAIAQSASYLFLDEPFAAQDLESASRIKSHLRVAAENGIGIIVVAHVEAETLGWCDSVVRLPSR
jgi:iron complex transport system ATP-binding protein